MTYDVEIAELALHDIDEFAAWLSKYSVEFMLAQIDRLEGVFRRALAQSPATWGHFFITGAPYRAYLFRVGRRTSYWIVYIIDEDARRVAVLRFWSASRDTESFAVGGWSA